MVQRDDADAKFCKIKGFLRNLIQKLGLGNVLHHVMKKTRNPMQRSIKWNSNHTLKHFNVADQLCCPIEKKMQSKLTTFNRLSHRNKIKMTKCSSEGVYIGMTEKMECSKVSIKRQQKLAAYFW